MLWPKICPLGLLLLRAWGVCVCVWPLGLVDPPVLMVARTLLSIQVPNIFSLSLGSLEAIPTTVPSCVCFRLMIWFLLNFVLWGRLIITGPRVCLSLLAFNFLIYLFKTFFCHFWWFGKGRVGWNTSAFIQSSQVIFFSKSFEVFLWAKDSVLIIRGGNSLIFASQYLNRC